MPTPLIKSVSPIYPGTSDLEFEQNFEVPCLPALLKGFCRDWPAYSKWTLDFFATECGDVEVPVSNYALDPYQKARQKRRVSLKDYVTQLADIEFRNLPPEDRIYAAGWHYMKSKPQLSGDIVVPSFFKTNWIERVQSFLNFDWTSIFIGHSQVESPLHTDSFFVGTWLAVLSGTKVMRLIPGEYSGPVRNNLNVFDDGVVADLEAQGIPIFEVTIEAGDIAYIPPGWWHHVKNKGITIAVSNNFVSKRNFLVFEQQIRAKFLKPLLELNKLKDEAIAGPDANVESIEAYHPITSTFKAARYFENERRYVSYFESELRKTTRLLNHCQSKVETA